MKFNPHKWLCAVTIASIGTTAAQERILLLNEGNWQTNNGKLTYFEDGKIVSNEWFREVNGTTLGDTPNDIIQVNDQLIAIAINWSNIIQFISPDGKAVAATEDVPNNRKLATDGSYVYVSSYGHECETVNGLVTFEKGFVAKIDVSNFKVVQTCEVGYEPEGIAYYKGYLFVANTGGYAFNEDHEYETTVSILDAATLTKVRDVDTKQINLYGKMSQSGKYLCINSPGDYYDIPAASIIFDCDAALSGASDSKCFVTLETAATYNCTTTDGRFFAIGSRFSYYTNEYLFDLVTINPEEVMQTGGAIGVSTDYPGTVYDDLCALGMPYGIYVNPYTGYIYATDAGSFAAAGALYQWTPDGKFVNSYKVYINPAHFLALPPDEKSSIIEPDTTNDKTADGGAIYNLQGIKVANPTPGQIYIKNGHKYLVK
jgi:DNA-binding beta-propeller fold protein YncE